MKLKDTPTASGSDPRTGSGRKRRLTIVVTALLLVMGMLQALVVVSVSTTALAAPVGQGFNLNASDLRFILKQIQIAENHVGHGHDGQPLRDPGRQRAEPDPERPGRDASCPGGCAPSTARATTWSTCPGAETLRAPRTPCSRGWFRRPLRRRGGATRNPGTVNDASRDRSAT